MFIFNILVLHFLYPQNDNCPTLRAGVTLEIMVKTTTNNIEIETVTENKSTLQFDLTTIDCPFMSCSCQPDTHITKWQP